MTKSDLTFAAFSRRLGSSVLPKFSISSHEKRIKRDISVIFLDQLQFLLIIVTNEIAVVCFFII